LKLPISGIVSILVAAATRNDEQNETGYGSHAAAVGPLDLPSHKTAGQDIYPLQYPDNSHRKQQYAHDSQCYTHP
jgi:hypothetical protein